MNKNSMDYKYIPRTKAELRTAILAEVEIQGREADLNCIDTSEIKDMSRLFAGIDFNGDISGWNFESVGKLTLPESFEGDIPIMGMSHVIVEASPKNRRYHSVDGVLFSKDMSELIHYPSVLENEEYEVPEGVKTIGEHAFNYAAVDFLTLPSGVETIEARSFWFSEIYRIVIPPSVSYIGHWESSDLPEQFVTLPENVSRLEGLLKKAGLEKCNIHPLHNSQEFIDIINNSGLHYLGDIAELDEIDFWDEIIVEANGVKMVSDDDGEEHEFWTYASDILFVNDGYVEVKGLFSAYVDYGGCAEDLSEKELEEHGYPTLEARRIIVNRVTKKVPVISFKERPVREFTYEDGKPCFEIREDNEEWHKQLSRAGLEERK